MASTATKQMVDDRAVNESSDILLEVKNLAIEFSTDEGVLRAVDGVSLRVPRGKTLGVVGESGCGKSVTAMSILRLIPSPPGRVTSGSILYDGQDLLTLSEEKMRTLRGNRISMIFQEPMTSLNPVFSVGEQIAEAVRLHQSLGRRQAREKSIEMLRLVGIPAPEERADVFPHELSGGMRQRVMIAIALACRPDLLIADEPTTALDVTIQAQIMDLMQSLQDELGMSIILITHDLGVVASSCDHVQVMYAGRVVESAPTRELFRTPHHPYSLGLLRSVPGWKEQGKEAVPLLGDDGRPRLRTIRGMVPSLNELPPGCRFQDRCDYVQDDCKKEEPPLVELGGTSSVACLHPLSTEGGSTEGVSTEAVSTDAVSTEDVSIDAEPSVPGTRERLNASKTAKP